MSYTANGSLHRELPLETTGDRSGWLPNPFPSRREWIPTVWDVLTTGVTQCDWGDFRLMGRRQTKAERAAMKAAEDLKTLLCLCEDNGVDTHDLRQPVAAAFMYSDPDGEPHPDAPQYRMLEDAAVVLNNEGIERQVDALYDILGFERTRALILKNGSVLKAMAKAVDQAEQAGK